MQESILRVGKVTSVKGRIIEITVDKSKNVPHLLFNGELIRNVSVGSYVKINKGFSRVIGIIESEFIAEDKSVNFAKEYKQQRENIKRILQVKLVGFLEQDRFSQGIKELPLIDNICYILTKNEYDKVHSFSNEVEKIEIGVLASETSKNIELGVNSLFASHIGIFGNTGSGKSYSLASLYNSLFSKYSKRTGFKKNAKFLVIDFNGEYLESIWDDKAVFKLNTKKKIEDIKDCDKLPLNESAIVDIEIISILAEATEKTQKPFLQRAISRYKKVHEAASPENYFKGILKIKFKEILQSKQKERAFDLVDFFNNILVSADDDFRGSLFQQVEWHDAKSVFKPRGSQEIYNMDDVSVIEGLISYGRIDGYKFPDNRLERLIDFLYIQIIEDLLVNRAKNEHISPAINKLKSKAKELYKVLNFCDKENDVFLDQNFVIVDLNEVRTDIKKTIPLLIAYKSYQEQKESFRKGRSSSLNIIIDEAHNILSYTSSRESESWKDYRLEVFEEIIKEGRKFGTFLTIASQRPSDISTTIISQLHNYFIHRLINNKDIEAVEKTVSYLDKVSFDSLPILPTGTCILAGLSASLPVTLRMKEIENKFQPNSQTIRLTDFWNFDSDSESIEKKTEDNDNLEDDDNLPF